MPANIFNRLLFGTIVYHHKIVRYHLLGIDYIQRKFVMYERVLEKVVKRYQDKEAHF